MAISAAATRSCAESTAAGSAEASDAYEASAAGGSHAGAVGSRSAAPYDSSEGRDQSYVCCCCCAEPVSRDGAFSDGAFQSKDEPEDAFAVPDDTKELSANPWPPFQSPSPPLEYSSGAAGAGGGFSKKVLSGISGP